MIFRDVDAIGGVCRGMARSGGGPHPPRLVEIQEQVFGRQPPLNLEGRLLPVVCWISALFGRRMEDCLHFPRHSTSRLLSCISASLFRFPVALPCSTRMERYRASEREKERDGEKRIKIKQKSAMQVIKPSQSQSRPLSFFFFERCARPFGPFAFTL